MSHSLRLGVLASGRGSNLQAILDAIAREELNAEVVVVVSDREDAQALERARTAGVPAQVIPPGRFRTRLEEPAEAEMVRVLRAHEVELVVLAGFMRILHQTFLDAFAGAIINIHPALLPAFPGLDAQHQALECGVKIAGCTVHFVDPGGVDMGAIIGQRAVPVLDTDTRDDLADRILIEEHKLLVEVLGHFAAGRVRRDGRRVRLVPGSPARAAIEPSTDS
jgi:phosphoribosylglycinamide formyltransferase-1